MKHTRRSSRITTMLAALAFAAMALAGCSGSADPDENSSGPAPEGDTQSQAFASDEEFQLAFAACMREQGIDMPDPGAEGAQLAAGGEGFQEAALTCVEELGEPPSGSGGARPSEEQHDLFLQMAQCFRDHGLDVPDPAPEESLTIPMDAPQELLDQCATAGEAR